MRKKVLILIVITVLLSSLLLVQTSMAKQKNKEDSVSKEILQILYKNEQIDSEQYHKLLKKIHTRKTQAHKDKGTEKIYPRNMEVYWKNGLYFENREKDFKLKLGGRILNDWGYVDADEDVKNKVTDENNNFGSGTELRQGRLHVKGRLYKNLVFMAQYDFAGGDVNFKDTWIGFEDLPYVGNLKLGHFKEPFSLEELTSRKFMTFMERSLPGQPGRSFVPARNTGVMLYDTAWKKNMTWAIGGFRETDSYGNDFGDNEGYNLTTRLTAAPIYADNGKKVLHMGLAYSHKWLDDNATDSFKARPESHLTTDFVDTANIHASNVDLLGSELAMVYGPFSLQGEYMHGFVDSEDSGDLEFNGYYAQGSYFLTGEHRNYSKSSGAFGRGKLKEKFSIQEGGTGAWEIALRYSDVDLNDKDIHAGEMEDYTVGLNWYLYSNLRIMFDYIYADLENYGSSNIYQSRFQLEF